MKTLSLVWSRFLFFMSFIFLLSACEKDKSFCVEDYSASINAKSGEVSFKLPTGTTYSGLGALPAPFTIGDYSGQLQSVVTKQTVVGLGQEVELVHFFDDGKGNTFWTNDKALFLPKDNTGAIFELVNVMDIVDGTGGFECASGRFVNKAEVNFINGTLIGKLTGRICGGCD